MQRQLNQPRASIGGGTPTLHRNAIAAVDKLATAGQPTLAAVTEAGSTLPASALNVSVSAGNRYGNSPGGTTAAITPTVNQAVRATIAQVANAEWYDIFISTDVQPKWVGRITEAQRAAGGFIISAVGTVTAGGGAGAGQVDLGIVGTGLANNVNPFSVNNAYTPALVTPFNCGDYQMVQMSVKLAVTDLRSLPTLVLGIWEQNLASTGDWHLRSTQTVNILTAAGQPLEQLFRVNVDGCTNLAVLVDTISGQGSACSIWLDPC